MNYRDGEGETATMLTEWQRADDLRAAIDSARREGDDALRVVSFYENGNGTAGSKHGKTGADELEEGGRL